MATFAQDVETLVKDVEGGQWPNLGHDLEGVISGVSEFIDGWRAGGNQAAPPNAALRQKGEELANRLKAACSRHQASGAAAGPDGPGVGAAPPWLGKVLQLIVTLAPLVISIFGGEAPQGT